MTALRLWLALASTVLALGCSSTLEVRKVEFDKFGRELGYADEELRNKPEKHPLEGRLYALPEPFLEVTPQGDGSLAVEVIYLPDLDHAYRIQARSKLAKHTLGVKVANGLLTEVTWNADTAATASELAGAAGEIAVKKVEEDAKARQAASDELKQEGERLETTYRTALGEVAKLELELEMAQEERDHYRDLLARSPGDTTALNGFRSAQLKVRLAEVKLEAARLAAAEANQTLDDFATAGGLGSADNLNVGQDYPEAPGPVLYAITEVLQCQDPANPSQTKPCDEVKPAERISKALEVALVAADQRTLGTASGKATKQASFQTAIIKPVSPPSPITLRTVDKSHPTLPPAVFRPLEEAKLELDLAEQAVTTLENLGVGNNSPPMQAAKVARDQARLLHKQAEVEATKRKMILESDKPIYRLLHPIGTDPCQLLEGANVKPDGTVTCRQIPGASTRIEVEIAQQVKPGDYQLKVFLQTLSKGKPKAEDVTLAVTVAEQP